PPIPTLFPYTTLFRSQAASGGKNQLLIINWLVVFDSRVDHRLQALEGHDAHLLARRLGLEHHLLAGERIDAFTRLRGGLLHDLRSEEHTSELQSPYDL